MSPFAAPLAGCSFNGACGMVFKHWDLPQYANRAAANPIQCAACCTTAFSSWAPKNTRDPPSLLWTCVLPCIAQVFILNNSCTCTSTNFTVIVLFSEPDTIIDDPNGDLSSHNEPVDSSKFVADAEEKLAPEKLSSFYYGDIRKQLEDSDVVVRRLWSWALTGVPDVWRNMVTTHWPCLLQYAGFSIEGRWIHAWNYPKVIPSLETKVYWEFSHKPSDACISDSISSPPNYSWDMNYEYIINIHHFLGSSHCCLPSPCQCMWGSPNLL